MTISIARMRYPQILLLLIAIWRAESWALTPKNVVNRPNLRLVSPSRQAPLPRRALQAVPELLTQGLAVNSLLAAAGTGLGQKMLTPSGLFHGWILGVTLWSTATWRAWSICVVYLVMGSLVTKIRKAKKERLGIAEGRGGARGPENVWGSAATAALCALCLRVPSVANQIGVPVLKLALVASLATKLSDTCASEIGKAFGKRTFLITTLKPVPPGTEGAVSLEGTVAGVGGSIIISLYAMSVGWVPSARAHLNVLISAFVATNFESYLGASIQGRLKWLTNEVVNFINTLVGALCCIGLARWVALI